ncbi:proton-coupled folate transporter-like isoform X1 [Schistocerca americana]|uniref:proton-coupled folate transporter-like isoform X1 n=1 Tax=Schistocerca americana TaxID=7009 RepID=UPI001F4F7629|nr:proton-coupled folate transporter-like isoform X1 [Schistocerca americana]
MAVENVCSENEEKEEINSEHNVQSIQSPPNMTVKQKLNYIFSNITVEPLLVLYLLPMSFISLSVDNFNLEKACHVNLNYSSTVCNALTLRNISFYQEEDNEAQRLVAKMATWRNALRSSFPAVLIIFVGSWSDRRARRKPLLLLPLVGELLSCIGLLLCMYFFFEWSLEVAGIMQALFPALTGSSMLMIMAVFSYIGDVTSVEMRTFRMGIVNILVFLCVPVGTLLSGVLLKVIGFYGMFSAAALSYTIGIFYGLFFLKEGREPIARPKGTSFFKDFFDWRHVVQTVSVAVRKRDGTQRLRILLLLSLFIAVLGPSYGEATVVYLFVRNRFGWDEVDASYFSAYAEFVNFVGTLILISLFSRTLKLDDSLIGIISCISKILASFVYAFSIQVWMFYLGPLVDILGGATLICVRSMGSKLVPSEELGRMNSLFGICEAFAPFIYGPMFAAVYASTLNTMAGAFLLFSSALTAPAIVFFGWMFYLQRKETRKLSSDMKLKSVDYTSPQKISKDHNKDTYEGDTTEITASWD